VGIYIGRKPVLHNVDQAGNVVQAAAFRWRLAGKQAIQILLADLPKWFHLILVNAGGAAIHTA
ncbi:MAG TPA: hypothetical protein VEU28_03150, partial [Actinomycetota bacterium]|nr:hypothetical protein [Actinomycetota bacterium]